MSMIRNIKETFPLKSGMWKSNLQDPGYVEGVKVHAACNVARLYKMYHVEGVEKKIRHNKLDLTHLFLMLKVSKGLYTICMRYIHRMKPLCILCTHT